MTTDLHRRPLISAGTLIGIGMGGFFDGILFHQILQLHNMLSNRVPKDSVARLEVNMFWDGLFHAFCWTMVVCGLAMLWHAVTRPDTLHSGRTFAGSLLLGWGVFNLVEGIINHELLQIHHVFQNGNHLLWDVVFLASGVALAMIGFMLIRTAARLPTSE